MMSVLIFVEAGLLSWLLGFPIRILLVSRGIVDRPNHRSSHVIPTARGGGWAILMAAFAICLGSGVLNTCMTTIVWACTGLIAVVSFIDDIRPLPALSRLACHFIAAISVWFTLFGSSHRFENDLATYVATTVFFVIWVVGYTNAFNFMDGINGLAGMQAAITGLGTAVLTLAWPGPAVSKVPLFFVIIIGGAAAGFLPHNCGQRRMFMGDVGSASLGFLLCVLPFWLARDAGIAFLPVLLLLEANFILDTGVTLCRRTLRGERMGTPHRDHYYQRLVRAGWTHRSVTAIEASLQLIVIAALYFYIMFGIWARIGIALLIIGQWLIFFLWINRILKQKENLVC